MNVIFLILFCLWGFLPCVWALEGKAEIKATTEEVAAIYGEAYFKTAEGGFLVVNVSVDQVWPAGKYELAIHEFGNCSDLARAAGGIFVPDAIERADVALAGILGVIEVGSDGKGNLSTTVTALGLSGNESIAGRSIVMILKNDNQTASREEPRVACGVIGITGR